MRGDHHYWFPAKRYGWGWSFPVSWEGWLVFSAFLSLLAAGFVLVLPANGVPAFIGFTILISFLFFAVCWFKGEPPRWRWGGE